MKYIDERSKCLQDPLLQPKLSFGSIKSKKNIFPYYSIDIIQHSKKQIPQTFRFGNNKSWDFPMKNMRYMLINSSLQKLSSKTIAAFTTSTRTDIKMQTYVKNLRALMTCSTFKRDYRQNHSNYKIFGKVHCPNKMCSLKSCAQRRSFKFSAETTVSLLRARIRVRCAMFPVNSKQTRFCC